MCIHDIYYYEGMPVISYDLFSNLVRLIKFNLLHNYTCLIRIYIYIYNTMYYINI